MKINGLQKLTLLDFPGRTACTVFLAGCNFRCPFCHNSELLNETDADATMDETELISFLKKRQGLLDGVCITGGEPTLRKDLPELFKKIRDLGFQCKLDTNGTQPIVVQKLIQNQLIDYIAMDIKTCQENYPKLTGTDVNLTSINQSINLIKQSNIEYEFRTTVVFDLHSLKDFTSIGQWLGPVSHYFLQPFVNRDSVLQSGLKEPTDKELGEYLKEIQKYIPTAQIRGRD